METVKEEGVEEADEADEEIGWEREVEEVLMDGGREMEQEREESSG